MQLRTKFDESPYILKLPDVETYPERSIMDLMQRVYLKTPFSFPEIYIHLPTVLVKKCFEPVAGYYLGITERLGKGRAPDMIILGCCKKTKYDLVKFTVTHLGFVSVPLGRSSFEYDLKKYIDTNFEGVPSWYKKDFMEIYWDESVKQNLVDREAEKGEILSHFQSVCSLTRHYYSTRELRLTRFKYGGFRAEVSFSRSVSGRHRISLKDFYKCYLEAKERNVLFLVSTSEAIEKELKMQVAVEGL